MTHTPNRLAVYENTLAGYGDNGRNFFLVPEGSYGNENAIAELTLEHQLLSEGETKRYLAAKSNARRLVACWNACTSIPTEALEKANLHHLIEELGGRLEGCLQITHATRTDRHVLKQARKLAAFEPQV